MQRFPYLLWDPFLFNVAPLLNFEDVLALRMLNKLISSIFSSDLVWEKFFKEEFCRDDFESPYSRDYFKHFLEVRFKSKNLEKLLMEAKVEETLDMLARDRDLLLPVLLKIIKKEPLKYTGLIYDAKHCIKILLALRKLKKRRESEEEIFTLGSSDAFEIEFALNQTEHCFRDYMEMTATMLIAEFYFLNQQEMTFENQTIKLVQMVASKYLERLKTLEKLKTRWKKPESLWTQFISNSTTQYNIFNPILSHLRIRAEMISLFDCLKVKDLQVGEISYIKLQFTDFNYQMIDGTTFLSDLEQIEPLAWGLWVPLLIPLSLLYKKILEKVVAEMNNRYLIFSQGNSKNDSTLKEDSINNPFISSMIRNRSYLDLEHKIWAAFNFGHESFQVVEKKRSRSSSREPGEVYGTPINRKVSTSEFKIGKEIKLRGALHGENSRNDPSNSVQGENDNYYVITFSANSASNDNALRWETCSNIHSNNVVSRLRFCRYPMFGAFFSHYDFKTGRFVYREEMKDFYTTIWQD